MMISVRLLKIERYSMFSFLKVYLFYVKITWHAAVLAFIQY